MRPNFFPTFVLGLCTLCFLPSAANAITGDEKPSTSEPTPQAGATSPLIDLLLAKKILTPEETATLTALPRSSQESQLTLLLHQKGILSDGDLATLHGASSSPGANPGAAGPQAAGDLSAAVRGLGSPVPATVAPDAAPNPVTAPKPTFIAGLLPIRVLPIDPPNRDGVMPAIRLGENVRILPYGFIKSTIIYDSSSPYGDDSPLPGFISDSGPNSSPELHVKVRSSRIGGAFEWADSSRRWVMTGKVETDFEGTFARSDNRNLSSIRSNDFQLRVAYGRLDYNLSDKTSAYGLFGQDWTLFGSSTLPSLFETTNLGAGFGTLYERLPQFRTGLVYHTGRWRNLTVNPDVAVTMPASGNAPSSAFLFNQLGYGERQGPDSAKPNLEQRLAFQFQADKAPGVAPAQVIFSGMYGSRSAIVLGSAVPAAFKTAFATGARVDGDRFGYTAEVQLPTRYFTLLAKYYNGEDLRFYFAGQLYSNFNDTTGLTAGLPGSGATAFQSAPSIDGASTVLFGYSGTTPVVAPQKSVRVQGGFVNLGIPISRIFGADTAGRNTGWTMYFHYGMDEPFARDVRRIGPGRGRSDLSAATLYYKLNPYVSFGYEQSLYRTKAVNGTGFAEPLFRGVPAREWNDRRSEFGPVFTF